MHTYKTRKLTYSINKHTYIINKHTLTYNTCTNKHNVIINKLTYNKTNAFTNTYIINNHTYSTRKHIYNIYKPYTPESQTYLEHIDILGLNKREQNSKSL